MCGDLSHSWQFRAPLLFFGNFELVLNVIYCSFTKRYYHIFYFVGGFFLLIYKKISIMCYKRSVPFFLVPFPSSCAYTENMYFPFKTLWRWYCLVIESVQQTAESRFVLNSHNHCITFRNKPTEKRQLKRDEGMRKDISFIYKFHIYIYVYINYKYKFQLLLRGRQGDLEEGAGHGPVSPLHFFARVGTICFYRLHERSGDLGKKSIFFQRSPICW